MVIRDYFIIVCCLIVLSLISMNLGMIMEKKYNFSQEKVIPSLGTNVSLQMEAKELYEEFSSWYFYNLSNRDMYWPEKNINWSFIKEMGGVCWHAAEWYKQQAIADGFNGEVISIDFVNKKNAHAIAIISSFDEYCILDQKNKPACFGGKYENSTN